MAIYETSIEIPAVLGFGSQCVNIYVTKSEQEAIVAYHTGGRNYLRRISTSNGRLLTERWDESEQNWRST